MGIAVGVLTAGEVTEGVDVAVGALVALGVCVAEAVADGKVDVVKLKELLPKQKKFWQNLKRKIKNLL